MMKCGEDNLAGKDIPIKIEYLRRRGCLERRNRLLLFKDNDLRRMTGVTNPIIM